MQALLEIMEFPVNIIEESTDKSGKIKLKVSGIFQEADKINNNKRRYPKAILSREIDKLNKRISEGGSIWGAGYHPDVKKGYPETNDISHKFNKFSMDEKGICSCELEVLPTNIGQNIAVLLKNGKLGLSSRGRGEMSAKKTENIGGKMVSFQDISDNYCLDSVDFVINPSVKNAQVTLSESMLILESAINEDTDELHPTLKELWAEIKQEKIDSRDYQNMHISEIEYWSEKDAGVTRLPYEAWLNEKLVELEEEVKARLDQRKALYRESRLAGFKKPFDFEADDEQKRQKKLIEIELKKAGKTIAGNLTESEKRIIGKDKKRGF